MAQFNHRVDLTKGEAPPLSSELGRTVLVANNRNTPTGEAENKPDILYMHNVMPTSKGLQSIGFKEIIETLVGVAEFKKVLHLHNAVNSSSSAFWYHDRPILFAYGIHGLNKFYINLSESSTWILGSATGSSFIEPTVANVKGKSYVLIRVDVLAAVDNLGAMSTFSFTGSPFHGVNGVYGITEAFGYLIAWGASPGSAGSSNMIAWSSLLNPLDLTPSATTGAGNGIPEGMKGEITYCAPNSRGFLIYCRSNVVAAIYTGNKSFPFKFVPIKGSKGMNTAQLPSSLFRDIASKIAYDTDLHGHFVYTAGAGLQLINSDEAKNVLPEVTDFLEGKILEDFDETLKTFSTTEVAADELMLKRLAYIAARYLVISYGITEYTHALIYDLTLQRWGKIKITHVDVFEHRNREVGATIRELAKEGIAFMDETGLTKVVSFNPVDTTRSGVLILGKYQYVRDRFLTLQRVTAENVDAADTFSCTDLASLDGRNTSSQVTGTETSGVGYRDYAFRSSAKNHSLAFIGSFIMNTLELLFTIGGRR